MMADTLVLYIESMPCEVGAAALASLVLWSNMCRLYDPVSQASE